jgi:hypothetical protein
MVNNLKKIAKDNNISSEIIPMVLLTHSKNFYSYDNFEKLFNSLTNYNEINFGTTQKTVEYFDKIYKNKDRTDVCCKQ